MVSNSESNFEVLRLNWARSPLLLAANTRGSVIRRSPKSREVESNTYFPAQNLMSDSSHMGTSLLGYRTPSYGQQDKLRSCFPPLTPAPTLTAGRQQKSSRPVVCLSGLLRFAPRKSPLFSMLSGKSLCGYLLSRTRADKRGTGKSCKSYTALTCQSILNNLRSAHKRTNSQHLLCTISAGLGAGKGDIDSSRVLPITLPCTSQVSPI